MCVCQRKSVSVSCQCLYCQENWMLIWRRTSVNWDKARKKAPKMVFYIICCSAYYVPSKCTVGAIGFHLSSFLLECSESGADGFRTIVSTLTKDMLLINSATNFIVQGASTWTILAFEWASKHWFLAMSSNRILKYAQCYRCVRCGRFQTATARFRKLATHENELLSLSLSLYKIDQRSIEWMVN